jgi:hypothetical protein
MILAQNSAEFRAGQRRLFVAIFAISISLHVAAWSFYQFGSRHGWWTRSHIPNWFQQQLAKLPAPLLKPKLLAKALQPQQKSVPTIFVDVTQPSVEPPKKETHFYGTADAQAANAEIKNKSELPNIDGRQDKVPRTVDAEKSPAKPLEPSPPKPKSEEAQTEQKPRPKESQPPGDLAILRPQDVTRRDTGKSANEKGEAATETHPRPRKLSEVKNNAALRSDKMNQSGGVNKLALSSSFDVKKSVFGDYDREFIDAVQQRWDYLFEQIHTFHEGRVVLEFQLHYDGRISDMKVVETNVGELLTVICEKAILDPAPYAKWPMEMRREVQKDHRDVTFTFHYLLF